MAISFKDEIEQKVGEIERPPHPPIGHYVMAVSKAPTFRETDEYDFVSFPCKGVRAWDEAGDVDPEELAEFGEPSSIFVTHDFIFDKNDDNKFQQTKYNMRRFLEDHLAIDGAADMSLKEAMAAGANHQFVAQLGLRPDKNDPEVTYLTIKKTAPLA